MNGDLLRKTISRRVPGRDRPQSPGSRGRGSVFAVGGLLLVVSALVLWLLRPADQGPGGIESGPQIRAGSIPAATDLEGLGAGAGDGGELRMASGRSSGGSARLAGDGRLSGRVRLRGSGAAVPGAQVRLLGVPPSAAGFLGRMLGASALGDDVTRRVLPAAVQTTDAAGGFAFAGVRAGTWYVDVQGDYVLGDDPVLAKVLPSGSGGPVTVWARPGGRVVGQVFAAEGQPAAGARVMLTQGPGVFLLASERGELRMLEQEADGEGRFAFPAVPPGDGYEVSAIGSGLTASHALSLSVLPGEDTEVVVSGEAGARVRGRILAAAEDGSLVPVAGAEVGAVPRGLRHLRLVKEILVRSHDVTGPDGSYELSGVPAGEVDVLARAPGYVPGRGPSVRCVAGGLHGAADLTLKGGPAARGRVVDGAGNPLAGVQVRYDLVDVGSMGRALSAAPLLAQAMAEFDYPVTGPEGEFVAGPLAGKPPYQLMFECSGYGSEAVSFDPSEQEGPLLITLRRGGGVAGTVVVEGSGEPVGRFTVETLERVETETQAPGRLNPFAGGTLFEDAQGRFELSPLKAGPVSLTVKADGYLETKVPPLTVEPGQLQSDVLVTLRRGGVVRGIVVNPDGQPIAGARVTSDRVLKGFGGDVKSRRNDLRNQLGLPLPPVRTRSGQGPDAVLVRFAASLGLVTEGVVSSGPDGAFELIGLEPGAHTLIAFHREWQVAREGPVEVAVDAPRDDVTIEMNRGASLYGTVRDRFGRPLAGAMVLALAPSNLTGRGVAGGGVFQGRTDEAGAYEIQRLEPGGYMAILTRGDEAFDPLSLLGSLNLGLVNVPQGQRVQHDIVDTSIGACRVHGRVLEGGQPVTRGSLVALAFEAPGLLGVDVKVAGIDSDGTYAFEGLAPGEYRFQIEGDGPRSRLIVDVPDAPELVLDLAVPSASVAGRVVDASTGEPIAGARVSGRWGEDLEPSGPFSGLVGSGRPAASDTTDAEGSFRLRRLGAGDWELLVEPPRGRDASWSPPPSTWVDLRPDEERKRVEIALEPGAELEGIVVDALGEPLPSALVLGSGETSSGMRPARATTDEQGAFRLRGLAPGEVRVDASADGFAGAGARIVIEPGADPEPLRLVLQEGSEVSVTVVDGAGAPVAGAAAQLLPAGGSAAPQAGGFGSFLSTFFSGELSTDGDGLLNLGRFAAGDYVLEVRKGFASSSQPVRIEGGRAETRLRATLP